MVGVVGEGDQTVHSSLLGFCNFSNFLSLLYNDWR